LIKRNDNITIIGSGLVGMTLALILSRHKINVTILEKNSKENLIKLKDSRTSAVSQGSKRILKEIGIWEKIRKKAQSIKKIIVTEGNSPDGIKFDSELLQEGPLGFIVKNEFLKKTFYKEVLNSNYINFIDNLSIKDLIRKDSYVLIKSSKGNLQTKLVVGADGRYSYVRYLADIKNFFYDYKQTAFVFNINHKKNHNSVALEKFFPSGPLALLPMKEKNGKCSSVVWTLENSKIEKFSNKKYFYEAFKTKYANAFGEIEKISTPTIYNLNIFSCYEYFKDRVVLIGDACQAIHPIAGQGLNLGLRDSNELASSILYGHSLGFESSNSTILRNFAQKRFIDKNLLIKSTHGLNKLFSNNSFIIGKLRENGLRIFNESNFLKKQSMLFAMGLWTFDF
tara:strand:- start:1048 stop:2235 length:1188 start_codon:yes stop_codon:yes gene_type:complete